MTRLMQACVEVWESDPDAYAYKSVGYIALGASVQEADLTAVAERHEQIGYRSELIVGERQITAHMRSLFPDWRAKNVTVCLHERQGGFAFNRESVTGLLEKAVSEGVDVIHPVKVTALEEGLIVTDRGTLRVDEQIVLAPGPWAGRFWRMLELPETIADDRPMWAYWNLQEGEIAVDPALFATATGDLPPVIHLDTDAPLYGDDGRLLADELWGIYFKRGRRGVQGGATPVVIEGEPELDPYPQTTSVDAAFPDLWCAGLAHALARFEGCRARYKEARSGGIGAFTADNFPIFDFVRPSIYGIFDSNHGYKMIGVGREVAAVLLGEQSSLLHPFRFGRFAAGELHPVSHSPYPWS
jgi:glycine/D-amino acid oxidase-like deaminating enzyme